MKKDEILSAIGIFFGIGIVALVSKFITSTIWSDKYNRFFTI